ncbi:MAG: sigma 54 modulation/S30EA ribosomal C-terminal domain-containing protein [Candidatus Aminicenantes bacterium]|nr:sigma 54 modulation/S30EA ribosomal C-terminal domain-containing protein [Candidatus Aminicenantes bacterium]
MKAFTEKQLKSIEKISGDIISAEVIVSEQKFVSKVELTVTTKLNIYHVEEKNEILKQALRKSLNILKSQAKKNKEKLKKDNKRTTRRAIRMDFFSGRKRRTATDSGPQKITVSNNFSKKPFSIEEAIFFLKDSGENAFMFINTETNKISVVFFNRNNEISIIEAN